MLAKERHAKILAMLRNKSALTTGELTQALGVSLETVRRDLLLLEQQGSLQRVHGGAIAASQMRPLAELSQRIDDNKPGKTELCSTAAMLIEEGDAVYIDSGSTAIVFAEAVKQRLSRLTVVTHSVDVFDILSPLEDFQVILCGGHYLKNERAFYGQLALDTLRKLHVQKAFVFPYAISLKHGIYDINHELVQLQQQIIVSADRVFILADSEKFEKTSLTKLSDLNPAFTYVTDSDLSQQYRQLYREQGLRLITCKDDIEREF